MKKEIILSVIFNVIIILISLFFTSYLTKNITFEEFGKYQLIINYIGIVGIFSFNGINMIINKNILIRKDYVFNILFLKTYKYVVIVFISLITLLFIINVFLANERIDLLYIALLFLPLLGLEKYDPVLNAKQKFVNIRLLNLLNSILYVGFAIFLLKFTNQYLYIFVSMFVVKLIIIAIGLSYAKRLLFKNDVAYNPKKDLIEGYKLSVLSVYNVGIGYLDKLILGMIDFKLLALYAIGILIPLRVKDQLKLVVNILIQSWAKDGDELYKKNVQMYHKYIFILALIFSILISYTSSFYIPILFTSEYLDSIIIIWIISLSIPFILGAFIHETFIVVFHNTSFYQKVTYSKQIFYLIFLAILTPYFGIIGIAVAFLSRSIYDFSINYIYYHKYKNRQIVV